MRLIEIATIVTGVITIIVLLSIRKKPNKSEPEKDFYKDWHENGPINE